MGTVCSVPAPQQPKPLERSLPRFVTLLHWSKLSTSWSSQEGHMSPAKTPEGTAPKPRKLSLQKETLKDLAPVKATAIKGGAPPVTKKCDAKVLPTTGC